MLLEKRVLCHKCQSFKENETKKKIKGNNFSRL